MWWSGLAVGPDAVTTAKAGNAAAAATTTARAGYTAEGLRNSWRTV